MVQSLGGLDDLGGLDTALLLEVTQWRVRQGGLVGCRASVV
jgi:hypothetical protein